MRRLFLYILAPLGLTLGVAFGLMSTATAGEVDDLKAAVQKLMDRIDRLESGSAGAPAKAVTSGNDKVKLSVSGQVNRALLLVDDGDRSKLFHVDNDNSSTRIRFAGSANFDDNYSAGALVEVQFESNSTANIDIDQDGGAGTNSFTERHLTIYFDSKKHGRVWFGQGDMASNGTSEVDLSGTGVIAYSGIADLAGGISFKNSATKAKLVSIGTAFSNMDGFSRRDRARYDTPTIAGFKASTSIAQGDVWDVALRYGAEYPAMGIKVVAAIAYGDGVDVIDLNQINGSISVLHNSGLNFTFASGSREIDGSTTNDPFFAYGKLGYRFRPFAIGMTSLSVDYGITDDLAAGGDEFSTFGVFAVQNVDKIGTEFYAGYRNHALDRTGVSVDDINAGVLGARVKF